MHRVLYDCFYAQLSGHSGIPHDTRVLAKTLSGIAGIDLAALLHTHFPSSALRAQIGAAPDVALALLLNGAGGHPETGRSWSKLLRSVRRHIGLPQPKGSFRLARIDNPDFRDAIWRVFFAKSLDPADRAMLGGIGIRLSDISEYDTRANVARPPFLDTSGFDFAVFQQTMAVETAAGTMKIMRYHDPIPILAADTAPRSDATVSVHYQLLKNCLQDSHLVCNSDATRAEVDRILPGSASKTSVIPYTMPDIRPEHYSSVSLRDVLKTRMSFTSLGDQPPPSLVNDLKAGAASLDFDALRYVVMVSSIEPRKNFAGAIAAFNRVRSREAHDLKFVIVGHPGWRCEDVLRAIAPGVEQGTIIHLANLDRHELLALYARAEALVFPSYAEGFGLTPVEALQCGTPAVVSDIPVHRWVMDDAALYADPYDVSGIADQLARLVGGTGSAEVRSRLLANAGRVLSKFSLETTRGQWESLFEMLARRRDRRAGGDAAGGGA